MPGPRSFLHQSRTSASDIASCIPGICPQLLAAPNCPLFLPSKGAFSERPPGRRPHISFLHTRKVFASLAPVLDLVGLCVCKHMSCRLLLRGCDKLTAGFFGPRSYASFSIFWRKIIPCVAWPRWPKELHGRTGTILAHLQHMKTMKHRVGIAALEQILMSQLLPEPRTQHAKGDIPATLHQVQISRPNIEQPGRLEALTEVLGLPSDINTELVWNNSS